MSIENGTTEMYTFGMRLNKPSGREYLVMTVRSVSEEWAKRHIESIFHGNYQDAGLTYWSWHEMDAWKAEVKANNG